MKVFKSASLIPNDLNKARASRKCSLRRSASVPVTVRFPFNKPLATSPPACRNNAPGFAEVFE
ncbi:unnamed protein product [Schistosoma mattheei]|uniref:Uncharacterized protein n=1 Tax=Schistosoma mattheei TaxID=31246 RepID=A0A3P8AGI2_9TREM|nr:unnamed protein product [Schistosoma mattheei]